MRLNRNTFTLLNDSIKRTISPKIEELEDEIEEVSSLSEEDIEDMSDTEAADRIIRYNQVVNRALRAKFLSRTRRRAI